MKFFRNDEQLKLRKQASSLSKLTEFDDVECGKNEILEKYPSCDHLKKQDDSARRRPSDYLQDLSPISAWIVRLVTQPPAVDVCANNQSLQTAAVRIAVSLAVLFGLPFLMWDSYPADWGVVSSLRHVDIVWSSLLHISSRPIAFITLFTAAVWQSSATKSTSSSQGRWQSIISQWKACDWKMSFVLSFVLLHLVIVHLFLQMAHPSMLWNPFMWGWYKVYLPRNIAKSLQGVCLDSRNKFISSPLCLSENDWQELSSGTLSSHNPDDVYAVQKGLHYLQHDSGGLIINALARNIADSIPALRQNVEGLLPFLKDEVGTKKMSLVIFENDSDDGTREALKLWAKAEKEGLDRYTVDLIKCGPMNPDCKLGIMDRYDNMPVFSNPNASGVGKLGEFRQIALDYIMEKPEYKDFSHMVILDVDLGTSISPLGLLHSLGLDDAIAQNYVVASSSSQVWPGTFGSILPPYDLSAFRPLETEENQRVRGLHKYFCELMPKGDRWRNMCEACSPMQLFLIQSYDDVTTNGGRPYQVTSAFNGLTIYPLSLIRKLGKSARYDSGDDNQRCEHVGFHLSLQKPVYVNPKWTMNLKPSKPGGPTGLRAIKTLLYAVVGRPVVMFYIVFGNLVFFYLFVTGCWMFGVSVKSLVLMNVPQEKKTEKSGDNELERKDSAHIMSGIGTREM